MPAAERVFALILAAGESRRLGRPKQLLELAGTPVVAHVVERALQTDVDGVVVVIGSHASEVELELRGYPVYRVFNPQFTEGQGASLASGIRAMPSTVDAVVVLLGDMPGVAVESIQAVIDRWRETHTPAVVATYGEERRHPVLFDRSVFFELASLDADKGGREILRALGDMVEKVPVAGKVPSDIDTEDDWEQLQNEWS